MSIINLVKMKVLSRARSSGPTGEKGATCPAARRVAMFGIESKVFRRFQVRNIHEFGYRRVTHDEHVSQGPDTVRARRPCRPTWEVAIGHAARTNRKELFFC